MRLYLLVSNDRYELPFIVEDSAERLADKIGVTRSNVFKTLQRAREGKYHPNMRTKITMVEVDDD